MDITIGREASSSKLSITLEKKAHIMGEPMSVPKSVSREHCTITIADNGTMRVKNINPKTMESKKIPNLYFAGEVLDLDGPTGGYNLKIAFSTGYLAGLSASKK